MNASAQLCQPMSPIETEIDALRQRFPSTNVLPLADGSSVVSVPGIRLDPGWSKDSITVHFLIPVGYPHAQPDCFNVDIDLTLSSGALPQSAQHQQLAEVGQTLWFSWHLQRPWKPGRDTLSTWLGVIMARLSDVR